jgi:hypothetical protein
MKTNIRIPIPCHENWDEMLPEQQGKHCLKCCKTVVDFTGWEIPAITDYLTANAAGKVCGRFNAEQLNMPLEESRSYLAERISSSGMSIFKKVAAVFLIAFGMMSSSCLMGKAAPVAEEVDSAAVSVKEDVAVEEEVPHFPVLSPADVINKDLVPKKKVTPVINCIEPIVVGEPAIVDIDTVVVQEVIVKDSSKLEY